VRAVGSVSDNHARTLTTADLFRSSPWISSNGETAFSRTTQDDHLMSEIMRVQMTKFFCCKVVEVSHKRYIAILFQDFQIYLMCGSHLF